MDYGPSCGGIADRDGRPVAFPAPPRSCTLIGTAQPGAQPPSVAGYAQADKVRVMNCQEFWNTIPELGDCQGHPHLAECPACAARIARHRELEAGFRALAA